MSPTNVFHLPPYVPAYDRSDDVGGGWASLEIGADRTTPQIILGLSEGYSGTPVLESQLIFCLAEGITSRKKMGSDLTTSPSLSHSYE